MRYFFGQLDKGCYSATQFFSFENSLVFNYFSFKNDTLTKQACTLELFSQLKLDTNLQFVYVKIRTNSGIATQDLNRKRVKKILT